MVSPTALSMLRREAESHAAATVSRSLTSAGQQRKAIRSIGCGDGSTSPASVSLLHLSPAKQDVSEGDSNQAYIVFSVLKEKFAPSLTGFM